MTKNCSKVFLCELTHTNAPCHKYQNIKNQIAVKETLYNKKPFTLCEKEDDSNIPNFIILVTKTATMQLLLVQKRVISNS